MPHHSITTAVMMMTAVPSLLLAQIGPPSMRVDANPASVNATGRSVVRVPPDRATLLIVVQSNAATPAEAAETVARNERAVVDTLLKLGVARTALTSTSYGVGLTRTPQGMGAVGSFYSGRIVLALSITQLDRTAALTAAALARGAALIGQPRFESTQREAARTRAFREAVEDATRQATLVAEGMGGRLGRLRDLTIDEQPQYNEGLQRGFFPLDTPYDNQERPLPEVTVTVTVRGRWEVVTGPP